MGARLIFTTEKFGRLAALSVVPRDQSGRNIKWVFICDCGATKEIVASAVVSGITKSCGCIQREIASAAGKSSRTHGMIFSPEYRSWKAMRARCLNPDNKDYGRWGARGITICERWSDFAIFYADMGPRPSGTSIDRINVNGNYEPANCRWATSQEQGNNRRSNVMVTFEGATHSVAEWAALRGLERKTLEYRIRSGWAPDKALTTPSLISRKAA